MLTLARAGDRERLERFCGGSLPGAYLACRLQCYGFSYDFVRFWFAEQNGRVNALLGSLDSTAVLLAAPDADHEELAVFLRMQSFSSVLMSADTAQRCGFLRRTEKQTFVYRGTEAVEPAECDGDLRAVYRLISQEIPGAFSNEEDAYLRFLSDFTFRRRRERAHLSVLSDHGALCACALTAAESDTGAVLSGVASAPQMRGRGCGRRVVLSLAEALRRAGKTVYVIALNDSAAGFYRALGFHQDMTVVFIERDAYV